ncbi:IclR family transcriptional regulator [Nocardioides massiliensis]|uniref:DNA-binding IclR family transcriptional regulator n=1 Tax=Nocardioides massiliensis TaxID=1325935 RepID=A0ABT9NRT6_9ACTN|nr:helix-turn-helix domain-containing protein [Nocardioides massiliensis]MDP9822765.1 DNA-binding IclR family transcriptional regulator [Nocardioides massiliensis]
MSESRPAPGAQTLARGLRALELVAHAPDGAAIQEIAAELDVHRSIASRILSTLAEARLVVRGGDGRYRTGAGLAALGAGIHSTLRAAAEPAMRDLAVELNATVSLLVTEGPEAVALAVIEPPSSGYVLSFRTGSRHPLERGSAGLALLAAGPARAGEPEAVTAVREQGYASTFGEVEPGAYGVAVPLEPSDGIPTACLNLITYRPEIAESAPPLLVDAAKRVAAALA